jgi:hypothetical protein
MLCRTGRSSTTSRWKEDGMRSKKARAYAAVVGALGLLPLAGPAQPAFADPAGCTKSINGFGQYPSGELWAQLAGSCNTNLTRILRGEIKHDLNNRPDPVVTGGTDSDVRTYLVALQSCDNNNTASYYARVFFNGYSDYKDSAHNYYDVC